MFLNWKSAPTVARTATIIRYHGCCGRVDIAMIELEITCAEPTAVNTMIAGFLSATQMAPKTTAMAMLMPMPAQVFWSVYAPAMP